MQGTNSQPDGQRAERMNKYTNTGTTVSRANSCSDCHCVPRPLARPPGDKAAVTVTVTVTVTLPFMPTNATGTDQVAFSSSFMPDSQTASSHKKRSTLKSLHQRQPQNATKRLYQNKRVEKGWKQKLCLPALTYAGGSDHPTNHR